MGDPGLLFDKKIVYEVLVSQDNRWIFDSEHSARANAMARAQALLDANQHDAVRVTREENDSGEEVVFQNECSKKAEKPITISPVDEAPLCTEVDDFCGFEARRTTGRVLRKFLDDRGITALELLHNLGNIRQLEQTGNLADQALQRIGSLQARSMDEQPSKRNDILYRLASQLKDRVQDIENTTPYLQHVNESGLSRALEAIDSGIGQEIRNFFTNAVLADYMAQQGDWGKKLDLALDLLDHKPDDRALNLVDGICAEIMDGSEAVKDILGPQKDLVSAVSLLSRLRAARLGEDKKQLLARFSTIMGRYNLPLTRMILQERMARALSGTQPLTRENDEADKAAFLKILKELLEDAGFAGGGDISEALTRRAGIVLKDWDGDLSPDESISVILKELPSRAAMIGYLFDLRQTQFGEKHSGNVEKALYEIVSSMTSAHDLLPDGHEKEQFIKTLENLQKRIKPSDQGWRAGELISSMLTKLIMEGGKEATSPDQLRKDAEKTANVNPRLRSFKAGEIIFNEGDHGDEAFMIHSGEVEISLNSVGHEVVLAKLGRGEIFGEMALIDNQPRMAAAKALSETTLSTVSQEAFKKKMDWLAEEDRLIKHILEVFVSRLREQASHI